MQLNQSCEYQIEETEPQEKTKTINAAKWKSVKLREPIAKEKENEEGRGAEVQQVWSLLLFDEALIRGC